MRTSAMGALSGAFGLALSAAAGAGCASLPANAKTTVLSLEKLDSGDSGVELAKGLSARAGIYKVVFSLRKAELRVVSAPEVDVLAAVSAAKTDHSRFSVALGAGHGSYEAWGPPPDGLDMKIVSEGGVDVADLGPERVPGKVTIMDFSAKWCEPCRMLDAHILRLMRTRADVAYRKLDVADWDSPLAQHYMKDVAELPYVVIFDKSGREVAKVMGLDTDRLDAAVEAAR